VGLLPSCYCVESNQKNHISLSVFYRGVEGVGGGGQKLQKTIHVEKINFPYPANLPYSYSLQNFPVLPFFPPFTAHLPCSCFTLSHSLSSLLLSFRFPQLVTHAPPLFPLPQPMIPASAYLPCSYLSFSDGCLPSYYLFLLLSFLSHSLSFSALVFDSSHSLTSLLYLPSSLSLSSLLLSFLLHQPVFLAHIFPPLKAYLPCFYLSSANSLSFPALTYISPPTAYPP
jgi:hypothetical protein